MRKTLTALAATGLLLVAACADEHEGAVGDRHRPSSTTTTTSGPDEPDQPGQTTTTTSGDPGDPGGSGDPGGQTPDDNPDNNEACEGQTPVWAFAPTDPSGQGAPADAAKSQARAELAAYTSANGAAHARQQPADDCAQPEPHLGTGDVQITLRWQSSADLDLHVTEPDGTEIWYSDKGPTATGGRLDVDSNVGCDEDGSVENVFWPDGQMPEGRFLVEVTGYQVDGCGGGQYTVVAKVRGQEVLRESGSVGEDETDPYRFDA